MTHSQFRPYHNCPIRFRLANGINHVGLLFDQESNYYCNPAKTTYHFIKGIDFQNFQTAAFANDIEETKRLSGKIDIAEIIWAERIIW